jgi:hypothetical protein
VAAIARMKNGSVFVIWRGIRGGTLYLRLVVFLRLARPVGVWVKRTVGVPYSEAVPGEALLPLAGVSVALAAMMLYCVVFSRELSVRKVLLHL